MSTRSKLDIQQVDSTNVELTRPVGAVGECTNIGDFQVFAGGQVHRISVTITDSSHVNTKYYTLATSYDEFPNGVVLTPERASTAFGASDFELIAWKILDTVTYRLRRTTGTVAGTYRIAIESLGDIEITETFTPATGVVTGCTTAYPVRTSVSSDKYETTRPMAPVGQCTDVASYNVIAGSHAHTISVVVSNSSNTIAKYYIFTPQYNQFPGGISLVPERDSGAFGVQNFELIAFVNLGVVTYSLRRTSGNVAGTYHITIDAGKNGPETITPLTGVTNPCTTVYPTGGGPTAAAQQDFWRSGNLTGLPDGVTDVTESIKRTGKVGIGGIPAAHPIATLDLQTNGAGRSGAYLGTANTPSYITGPLSSINPNSATVPTGDNPQFLHANQTQGVGIAFDGLYRVGSGVNLPFNIRTKGTGGYTRTFEAGAATSIDDYSLGALTTNSYTNYQAWRAGINVGNHWYFTEQQFVPASGTTPAKQVQVRQQWDILANGGLPKAAMRLEPDMAELGNTSLWVGENRANNRKIVLFDAGHTSAHQFYGFGINSATLRYQVNATGNHRFFIATSATASKEVVSMINNGNVGVDMPAPPSKLYVNGGGRFGTATNQGQSNANANNAILNAQGPTPIGSAVSAGEAVFRMYREGTSGVAFGSTAEFRIGKAQAGLQPTTEISLWIGNGSNTSVPNTQALKLTVSKPLWTLQLPVHNTAALAAGAGLVAGDYYKNGAGAVSQL